MDAGRRARYLGALGIDAWVPRSGRGAPQARAAGARTAAERTATAGHSTARSAELQPAAADADAREVAGAWDTLRAEVETCTQCPLHRTRTRAVFGVGDLHAQWLVVGEAPGAEEDRQGEPFVGRGGQLLDAMLLSIGLARGRNVYIANVLKSRPPNNRDPKPEEVASCLPYLKRQIALIKPVLILAVGRIAAHHLLGVTASLGSLRGRVHRFGELNTPVVVTYHPAYLLRTPADKRKAWEDLKFARSVFRELTSAA
ncbi:MAG: uracil-DNA glycosylase [Steroidobacteraceae bacterium]